MTEPFELDRRTFLSVAEAFGLEADASHMEDLYAYVQGVLPGLKCIRDLDLTGIEPLGPPVIPPSLRPGRKKIREKD
jgi:hypothetical protein